MKKSVPSLNRIAAATALTISACGGAQAVELSGADSAVKMTWTTDLTAGGGVRLRNPSCGMVGDPTSGGCGARADSELWSNGDDGNLNYKRGQAYSAYLGVTSEFLVNVPEQQMKFLVRGTGLRDFAANHTQRTPLSDDAKRQIVYNGKILDLFVEKGFSTAEGSGRVRLGNQVMNWGEAAFLLYGINQTNAYDYQKYAIPGQQLKQIIQPAPMLSASADLLQNLSVEGYYQFRWNKNIFAPVGSYWSASDVFGRTNGYRHLTYDAANFNVGGIDAASVARQQGQNPHDAAVYQNYQNQVYNNTSLADPAFANTYGFPVVEDDITPRKNAKQYGVRFAYKPTGWDTNLGFYYMRYTDKTPVFTYRPADVTMTYLDRRDLYGISANLPAGDWALGAELAYRPRDAVAMTACFSPSAATGSDPLDYNVNGVVPSNCPAYRDNKRYQLTVNGQINLFPSTFALVDWVGATAGYFMAEAAWVYYPGVGSGRPYYSSVDGQTVMQQVAAGGLYWYNRNSSAGYTTTGTAGTANSVGAAAYFSLTYDNKIIPGWQVTPSIYHQQGLIGYSPGAVSALWMKGVKATSLGLTFTQNPAFWTAGVNFVKYWGGTTTTNPYRDRDALGFYATRTF